MIVIGITGGMASGKSTVARLIARDRYPHLDADALVHHLMATDEATIRAIGDAFPEAITNHMVSRVALSSLIARDPAHIKTLESILHPRVRAAEEATLAEARAEGKAAAILDIPLLFETGAQALCDTVVAVCAPLALRKQRAFARPGMREEKWTTLMARQLTDEQRRARADHAIDTGGTLEETQAQVNALLNRWKLA